MKRHIMGAVRVHYNALRVDSCTGVNPTTTP